MKIAINTKISERYKSTSQKVRVATENWVDEQIFCPSCGNNVDHYENNRPVADFFCPKCKEDYELKSKQNSIGNKILDGAYRTMISRLQSNNNPNFFLLNYNLKSFEVLNFFVIPKYFFVPEIIEKRKPLSVNARRAGWVGCNIILKNIPESGKVFYIKNKQVEGKKSVLQNWSKTSFLKESKNMELRGWILDIMNCVEKLGKKEFSLNEVYSFEEDLKVKHLDNKHVQDKIRQQLQFLRDRDYLKFVGNGRYKLV